MIYVLTYPDRIIDKIKYQIFGTMPMYSGDEIRYGGGMAELITHDKDKAIMILLLLNSIGISGDEH